MASKHLDPKGPLQAALLKTTTAATIRASEGQRVFNHIAAFLNKHHALAASLEPHLQRALAALNNNLTTMAQHHFRMYIVGNNPLLFSSAIFPLPPLLLVTYLVLPSQHMLQLPILSLIK